MKKAYKIAAAYLVFGLIAGLFTHEATYWTNFTGETVLSLVHTHAFVLGTAVFAVLPLFMKNFHIENQKSFGRFQMDLQYWSDHDSGIYDRSGSYAAVFPSHK